MNFQEDSKIYGLNTVLEEINGYEEKTPGELIEKNGNKDIFKLIKRGYMFDDDVLAAANITKVIRDERAYWEITTRKPEKERKELKKDTASYEEIMESISYIEVEEEEPKNEDEEDMEEFFENDDE